MKCKFCNKEAEVTIRYPRMHLCENHFKEYCENRVKNVIDKHRLIEKDEKLLVAVSGGKDSLVLAYILNKLGYEFEGLHIDLGIEDYSEMCKKSSKKIFSEIGLPLHIVKIKKLLGRGIGEVKTRRPVCSYCGLTKRYIMNKFAYDNGFTTVATGHNLDDESAFVFSNILHWNIDYLSKQGPLLEAEDKFVKKIKPLYELRDKEISLYASFAKIEHVTKKCKYARGATSIKYKKFLDILEKDNPGIKLNFIRGFLRNRKIFKKKDFELRECEICGMPSQGKKCAFCRFWRLKEPLMFQ